MVAVLKDAFPSFVIMRQLAMRFRGLLRRYYGAGGEGVALSALCNNSVERPMLQSNDLIPRP